MRWRNLEYVTTMGKLVGKRGRVSREIILDSLVSWHGTTSVSEFIDSTRYRRVWIDMIAIAT